MLRSCLRMLSALLVFGSVCCFADASFSAQEESSNDAEVRKQLLESFKETLAKLEELEGKNAQEDQATHQALYKAVREFVPPEVLSGNHYRILTSPRGRMGLSRMRPSSMIAKEAVDYIRRVQSNVKMSSPYWIGVQCESAEGYKVEIANQQVVTAEGGLLVNAVTSESPAESAGIQSGDVIAFLNDKPTNNIVQLVAVIDECKDNTADVSVVRGQEVIKLKVTPTLRKSTDDVKEVEDSGSSDGTRIFFELAVDSQVIPEDFEAVVRFKRGQPLSATIAKKHLKWDVTSGESVDRLPAEVQPFVKQLFQANASLVEAEEISSWTTDGHRQGVYEVVPNSWNDSKVKMQWVGPGNDTGDSTESKLDRIQEQMEQLQKAIKEIRNQD